MGPLPTRVRAIPANRKEPKIEVEDSILIYAIGVICMLSVGCATALTVMTVKDHSDPSLRDGFLKGVNLTLLFVVIGIVIAAFAVYFGIQSIGGFSPGSSLLQ